MKRILIIFLLLITVTLQAQTPQFSFNDLKQIDEAIAQVDTLKQLNDQLNKQIQLEEQSITLYQNQIQSDKQLLFQTKTLYLQSMTALAAYRIVKRSLFLKIVSFGFVKDHHDTLLEGQMKSLQQELNTWK